MAILPLVCWALVITATNSPPTDDVQLFMDPVSDLYSPWGLMEGNPSALTKDPTLQMPNVNYTAGATVFAAFDVQPGTYEIFVAIGRPGEPFHDVNGKLTQNYTGVSVNRYTTTDFISYEGPTTVLFLPNGPSYGVVGNLTLKDGNIWTVKSMDRNETGYLLMAYYGDACAAFYSPMPLASNSFKPTNPDSVNFKDHDDTNLVYSRTTKTWVDMQIMSAPWLCTEAWCGKDPSTNQVVCPQNLSDNGGCAGGPRSVSVRTSTDGITWSGDWGCSDPGPNEPYKPDDRAKCKQYNESGIRRADPVLDPPEMQFYRIRVFYVGNSGRFAAHALQYAASPAEVNNISNYGYWGPYCPDPNGGFDMCHKGHGYGKMHGPHIMEEWWVGSANQTGPEDLQAWARPYKRFRVVPHDVWLMSQPVVYNNMHVWVSDSGVYTVPLYRISGIYAAGNGQFSTRVFTLGETGTSAFYMNLDASWQGNIITGGCDEGCAAYVMVELQNASSGTVLPGYERGNCILMNTTDTHAPLRWKDAPALKPGTQVRMRIYFREATIYAVGQSS
eukprot:m.105565 g.105565  ORF g.105565 m.105565 type:complete len:556 (-) comp13880_c2_seq4:43-1710(-)